MAESLYTHAPYYRMLHHGRGGDLSFYMETTHGCRRVLEYGVGSGRVAMPMARRGQEIVGVDLSAEMLATLRADLEGEPEAVRDRVRLVHGNARQVELHEHFDVITCPFNGIAHHHTHEELEDFFARIREHLGPSAGFVFDVAIPDPTLLSGTTSDIPWFRDPVDGTVCRATERITYDPFTQLLSIVITTRAMEGDRDDVEMELQLRQFFPQETALLLRHHGFSVLQRADLGDVLGYVCRAD